MKKVKFVQVEWDDAASFATWQGLDDLPHVQACITRGWLLEENKKELILAASFQVEGSEFGEMIAIPRGMVKRIRRLKVDYGR